MTKIATISEFLLQAGTEYRLFDMGRVIVPLSEQAFLDLENAKFGAPQPRLQHAWFGLIFWNKGLSQQHYIWFIKLPLDEEAKLIAAPRMQFLQLVIDALGQQLQQAQDKQAELPDNPYIFRPSQQQLADFNAQCKRRLDLDYSEHYHQALAYLKTPAIMDWQQLAVQGMADLASQYDSSDVATAFVQNLTKLHPQVQSSLLKSLEHYPIHKAMSDQITALATSQSTDKGVQLDCVRALSQAQDNEAVNVCLQKLVAEDASPDLLLVISGRHWHRLNTSDLCEPFVQRIAEKALFSPVFSDLVMIPCIRQTMLAVLRNPNNSQAVQQAIGELFNQHKAKGQL